MVDWGKILENRQSMNVIKDFATDNICARNAARKINNPEARSEFNKAVKTHKTGYTRTLARKALRRRGVTV